MWLSAPRKKKKQTNWLVFKAKMPRDINILYNALRGLYVIKELLHEPFVRGWYADGFVIGADCLRAAGLRAEHDDAGVSASQLWRLDQRLHAAVAARERIALGVLGEDGFPVVREYDPMRPCLWGDDERTAAQRRKALAREDLRCWEIWDAFAYTVRLEARRRAAIPRT